MGSHKKFDSSSEDSDFDKKRSSTRKYDRKKKLAADSQSCSQESSEIPQKKFKHDGSSDYDDKKERRTESRRRDKERERDYKHRDDRSRNSYREYQTDGDKQRDRRENCNRRDEYAGRSDRYDACKDRARRPEKRDGNLTKEEIAKQRKMLWSKPKPSEEMTSGNTQPPNTQTANPDDKKAAVWTSSITASGVGGQQASKFLKLMGIKAPASAADIPNEDLQKEQDRQQKMMSDLDKQYQIARESTHTGRGMGLGFH